MNYFKQVTKIGLIGILAIQFSGCGTILYPERRGQDGGRVDAGIVLLDGLLLLLGVIPGVIAFAVDFSNGAIYLPESATKNITEEDNRIVRFDPNQTSKEELEGIISEELGKEFHFGDKNYKMKKVENLKQAEQYLNRK